MTVYVMGNSNCGASQKSVTRTSNSHNQLPPADAGFRRRLLAPEKRP
jgi:hypothetical protein